MPDLSDNERRRLIAWNDDISDIQSDIVNLKNRLKDLQLNKSKEMEKFNDDIDNLQQDIKDKQEDIKNIRDKIKNIKKENIMKKSELKQMIHSILAEEQARSEYQEFFRKTLDKFGVDSPDELSDEKKKEFFDYVDKEWIADNESVKKESKKVMKKSELKNIIKSIIKEEIK